MGSVGDACDNAMCESLFATLECELLGRGTFRTSAEARMAIFELIEGWCNHTRPHQAPNRRPPVPETLLEEPGVPPGATAREVCSTPLPLRKSRMPKLIGHMNVSFGTTEDRPLETKLSIGR